MAYAANHPQSVASLSTFGGVPPADNVVMEEGFVRFGQRLAAAQMRGIIPNPLPSPTGEDCAPGFQAILPVYFFDPLFDPARVTLTTNRCSTSSRTWQAIAGFDLTDALANLTAPVQVLFGEGDPFGVEWATESAQAFRATRPQPVILQRCGHFWQECEADYAAAWSAFLERSALPE
jgi:pimeloyl-ACP methyl ester carboxylesterase